jgi:hypothetical protein
MSSQYRTRQIAPWYDMLPVAALGLVELGLLIERTAVLASHSPLVSEILRTLGMAH